MTTKGEMVYIAEREDAWGDFQENLYWSGDRYILTIMDWIGEDILPAVIGEVFFDIKRDKWILACRGGWQTLDKEFDTEGDAVFCLWNYQVAV